jgi:hypothetical protein
MSTIDKQRIAAVRTMGALGYSFTLAEGWALPKDAPQAGGMSALPEADAMHSLLVLRADKLGGFTEGSDEDTELKMIADTVSAYEAKRWTDGVVPGGKG